ncbi:hypothetical protein EVAR_12408_1 [Eumeta japonica]|uniref:Uncharacterized protein n=1 Tax=Eumeta variegata TaxID=151549 RepID=A0A4C1TZD6_EUMVA|nr:hypothetical protein EVAR_12408_1 [Eumeta japonica]
MRCSVPELETKSLQVFLASPPAPARSDTRGPPPPKQCYNGGRFGAILVFEYPSDFESFDFDSYKLQALPSTVCAGIVALVACDRNRIRDDIKVVVKDDKTPESSQTSSGPPNELQGSPLSSNARCKQFYRGISCLLVPRVPLGAFLPSDRTLTNGDRCSDSFELCHLKSSQPNYLRCANAGRYIIARRLSLSYNNVIKSVDAHCTM